MTRDELQELAFLRLEDAKALLKAGKYSGAYYLAGYVVECGLKARVAKETRQYEFPDLNKVKESYTHNLERLINIAGLRRSLEFKMQIDGKFKKYWTIVKDWDETSRYELHSREDAQNIITSIDDDEQGVLKWLKEHW